MQVTLKIKVKHNVFLIFGTSSGVVISENPNKMIEHPNKIVI